jgi:YfiH family protein
MIVAGASPSGGRGAQGRPSPPAGVRLATSTIADGDFAIDQPADALAARRASFQPGQWVWLRQVHGAEVHVVEPVTAAAVAGREGDALVCRSSGLVLAVHTADCAPVLFTSEAGVLGAAHAGWKGLEAGVVGATIRAMREQGAGAIEAWLGPCIGPECYEFGAGDLDRLAARFGPGVRATTSWGTPALDVGAAVRAAAAEHDVAVEPLPGAAGCTACDADRWYSHRARQQRGRMASVVVARDP